MLNKESVGSLNTCNLDIEKHGVFRQWFFEEHGTLWGVNTIGMIEATELQIKVEKGDLEVVDLVDSKAHLLLTHTQETVNNCIMRKNQKTQLNRVSFNIPDKKRITMIKKYLIDTYGTIHGKMSLLLNKGMELYIKWKKGFVELREVPKKPDNSLISNDKGQITSLDSNMILEAFECLQSTFSRLESDVTDIKKFTVQSTLNMPFKAGSKIKKAVKGTVKSFKREDKFNKALRILENVMKVEEFGFTDKKFYRDMVKLTGQGDPRTLRSDLDMLEADNRIKKIRSNAQGTATYQFVENNQYHKYNSELACEKFIEGFKEAFKDVNACTVDELNSFIFKRDGLYDAQSQHKRLNWLIEDGCVKRHEVNPRLLLIQK